MVTYREPAARPVQAGQVQVERRPFEQVEAGFALALMQCLRAFLMAVFRQFVLVEELNVGATRLMGHPQHRLAGVPDERHAQRLVAGHHRLPGSGETFGIEWAVDPVAVPYVVGVGTRFQQGMQQ